MADTNLGELRLALRKIQAAIDSLQPETTSGSVFRDQELLRDIRETRNQMTDLLNHPQGLEEQIEKIGDELGQTREAIKSSQHTTVEAIQKLQNTLELEMQAVGKSQKLINQSIGSLRAELELLKKSPTPGRSYNPQVPLSQEQYPLKTLDFRPFPESKEPSA